MSGGVVGGVVEAVFVASRGSEAMRSVRSALALVDRGLDGDRYCEGTGFYSPHDVCQVTLIDAADLDRLTEQGFAVGDGEHRRNLVVRGVDLHGLRKRAFRVGGAVLGYDRPRPPCGYIQRLTGQAGFTRALGGHWNHPRGGICAVVVEGGTIAVGDPVEMLPGDEPPPLRTLP